VPILHQLILDNFRVCFEDRRPQFAPRRSGSSGTLATSSLFPSKPVPPPPLKDVTGQGYTVDGGGGLSSPSTTGNGGGLFLLSLLYCFFSTVVEYNIIYIKNFCSYFFETIKYDF
jgi:hypothetical protein